MSHSPTETRTTCCYCGTGCGVVIESREGRVTGVRGDPDHPSSRGKLCTKGSTLHLTMTPAAQRGRALFPEMRASKAEPRRRVDWDTALDHVADRFAAIVAEHGPDAVAFYVSGQLLTEDYYVFNKLAKGLIGTANIDTNSRLCMSSAVSGYQATLGVDAPPSCYEDIDHAACLFIAGSNTAVAHPVLYRRIEAARERNTSLKVVVVDPRRTETARGADLHLAILPGTDVNLFHAMLHVMLWEQLVDEGYIAARTTGFEALRDLVREATPQAAATTCGVRAEDIVTAARWFAASSATLSLYCQGLNQSTSGTAKNAALVNLHLATGHIGRPGAGPFSLTGQPNAMGGREVGGLATTLAAHRDLSDPVGRAEIQRLWGVDRLPAHKGLTAVELFEALRLGRVKAVWIACTNPAQSMPDLPRVREALEAAELVVLQEAYANTETAPYADVLLPAASWGEKEGTVTNSERRISRVRAAVAPPGEARADGSIACDFARRLERRWHRAPTLFPFRDAESAWKEHREATRGRDLDITGLSYAILERDGPQHWPFPEGAATGTPRLYEDGVFPTPDGRARFHAERPRPVAEPVDARHPLRLSTGRLRDQWHGMGRTGTVASLFGHVAEPRLSLSPLDMARRGLADGDLVTVASRRGALHVIAQADDAVRSGQAWLPMHWGRRFLGGRDGAGTNTLTSPAMDPVSRQPELKHAAIRVAKAALPWRLAGFALEAPGAVDRLAALHAGVAFLSVVPMGRDREGVLVRAGSEVAPSAEWLDQLDAVLGLEGEDLLRYEDARRGDAKRVLVAEGRLAAARLSGEGPALASAEWLRAWMLGGEPVAPVRRFLLDNRASAPVAGAAVASRIVCQCHGIDEARIAAALEAMGPAPAEPRERLAALQSRLACGTSCGSCLPEVRAMLRAPGAEDGRMVA